MVVKEELQANAKTLPQHWILYFPRCKIWAKLLPDIDIV